MTTPQLPPRENYWIQDGDNFRAPTDEEYAEYLSMIISQEGLTILPTEPNEEPTKEVEE